MCWFLAFLPTTLRNFFKIQEKSTVMHPEVHDYGLVSCVISWTNLWPEDPSSWTLLPPCHDLS